jgi:leucyl aminopeptidase (aminopeptidase T)
MPPSTPPAGGTPPDLSDRELAELVRRVFQPTAEDRRLAVLVDLPDAAVPDRPAWRRRREMARGWADRLAAMAGELGVETSLHLYRNPRGNNADLPPTAWRHDGGPLPATADELDPSAAEPMTELFDRHRLLIAVTEFSATAPLKIAARQHHFRAATMPGFGAAMLPALRLDYVEIDRRVRHLKDLLDRADGADLRFTVAGEELELHLDLRHRTAHASGGVLTEPGTAGNLPSGETYVVPYEGEVAGDPSRSRGFLPVELEGEVVVYRIEENRAVEVVSQGPAASREAEQIAAEPAYANLAELGLGVLADFGLRPIGEILLDEKLGLHIAFGRSDHFGGQVGAADFTSPEAVIHIDRVYLPETQPRVRVEGADLAMADGSRLPLMRDRRFVIWNRGDDPQPSGGNR